MYYYIFNTPFRAWLQWRPRDPYSIGPLFAVSFRFRPRAATTRRRVKRLIIQRPVNPICSPPPPAAATETRATYLYTTRSYTHTPLHTSVSVFLRFEKPDIKMVWRCGWTRSSWRACFASTAYSNRIAAVRIRSIPKWSDHKRMKRLFWMHYLWWKRSKALVW